MHLNMCFVCVMHYISHKLHAISSILNPQPTRRAHIYCTIVRPDFIITVIVVLISVMTYDSSTYEHSLSAFGDIVPLVIAQKNWMGATVRPKFMELFIRTRFLSCRRLHGRQANSIDWLAYRFFRIASVHDRVWSDRMKVIVERGGMISISWSAREHLIASEEYATMERNHITMRIYRCRARR